MNTVSVPILTLQSKLWPSIRAEIFRERQGNGATVWRCKCGSAEYPELATQRLFSTQEQAAAHANVVLGNA